MKEYGIGSVLVTDLIMERLNLLFIVTKEIMKKLIIYFDPISP